MSLYSFGPKSAILERICNHFLLQCFANESAVAHFVSQLDRSGFAGCKTTSVAISLIENVTPVTIALRPLQWLHSHRRSSARTWRSGNVSNARLWMRYPTFPVALSRALTSLGTVSMCTATESCEIFVILQIHLQSTVAKRKFDSDMYSWAPESCK